MYPSLINIHLNLCVLLTSLRYRLTQPLVLDGDVNDVRPQGSGEMEWWWEVAVKWTTATYAAPQGHKAAGEEGGTATKGGEARGTTIGVDTLDAGDTVHDDVGGSSVGDDGKVDTLNHPHRGKGIIPATRYTSSHIGYPSTITYWLPSEPTVFWHSE